MDLESTLLINGINFTILAIFIYIYYQTTIIPIKKDLKEIKEKLTQLTQKKEKKSKDE